MEIKLIVIDVDGTMTDGGIYYDEHGNETKKFCTKDAAGFFVAKKLGIDIMVLTGRECVATKRRMKELSVDLLYENIKDKLTFLNDFMKKHELESKNIMYIGDDLNDLQAMTIAGYIGCPADACKEVKNVATYVSNVCGGCGAVRDVLENYFEREGLWAEICKQVYNIGI